MVHFGFNDAGDYMISFLIEKPDRRDVSAAEANLVTEKNFPRNKEDPGRSLRSLRIRDVVQVMLKVKKLKEVPQAAYKYVEPTVDPPKRKNENSDGRSGKRVKYVSASLQDEVAAQKEAERASRLVGEHACAMCKTDLEGLRYLNPVRCMKTYGASTAHRVCEDCWFGKFAPGTDHRCPGCAAEMPRPTALPAARVEYHDEVL